MTTGVRVETSQLPLGKGFAHIRLDAPRSNALDPDLIEAIHTALDSAENAQAILISGGRNFSTGGDVSRFLEAARAGHARDYARLLVPRLQDLVLRMVSLPALVAVAARGAITGGSGGMVFAADLTVVSPDAFVQPYYARVGFAPDGGWAALLPDLIGVAPARSWLMADQRMTAPELVQLGLAAQISKTPEDSATALLANYDIGARLTAKSILWDAPRRAALRDRLTAEADAFVARITHWDVAQRMEAFLSDLKVETDV